MNPPPSKGYQSHLTDDGHYPPAMHYDSTIRRSNEDRAGTPTVRIYIFPFILRYENDHCLLIFLLIYCDVAG